MVDGYILQVLNNLILFLKWSIPREYLVKIWTIEFWSDTIFIDVLQTIVWWIDNFEIDSTSAFVKSVLHVTSNKQRLHLNYDGHLYQQFETAFFTPTFNQNGKSYAVQKNILCSLKKKKFMQFCFYFIRIIYKFKTFTVNWKMKDFFY